ncbi:MAG TPA: AbrB/MazE/SpoVT family DNA-binding domain-containing protein [Solirubrobacterales bacterium]|nr:AbrB/MazE/SpoVT family DNA-binding domain-containing protein [Solirubrobacterales bacterium]
MRITSKGQVTIPKGLRDGLGFLPGTEVEFFEDGNEIRIRKTPGGNSRGREVVERLKRASGGDIPMSTEEIMRLTRGEDWGTERLEEGDGDPR